MAARLGTPWIEVKRCVTCRQACPPKPIQGIRGERLANLIPRLVGKALQLVTTPKVLDYRMRWQQVARGAWPSGQPGHLYPVAADDLAVGIDRPNIEVHGCFATMCYGHESLLRLRLISRRRALPALIAFIAQSPAVNTAPLATGRFLFSTAIKRACVTTDQRALRLGHGGTATLRRSESAEVWETSAHHILQSFCALFSRCVINAAIGPLNSRPGGPTGRLPTLQRLIRRSFASGWSPAQLLVKSAIPLLRSFGQRLDWKVWGAYP